jgi:hypothetical protein
MNAAHVFRLVLAGGFIVGAVGFAQAEELTAKQLEAKGKLETIFSCYPGFDKYTMKQVEALLKTYGAKQKKFQGNTWFVLNKPLELFSGKARIEVNRIRVNTNPETENSIFDSFIPKLTLEHRQAIEKALNPDEASLSKDEGKPALIDVELTCSMDV